MQKTTRTLECVELLPCPDCGAGMSYEVSSLPKLALRAYAKCHVCGFDAAAITTGNPLEDLHNQIEGRKDNVLHG